MASLKVLRNRIASVKATQKITKAMQMVAAAKLRRAQTAAEAARPFAQRMERVLSNLASSVKDSPNAPRLLAGTGDDKRHLLVVCTGDRGLAGGFNSSIARLARDRARKLQSEGKEVTFLCVGRKGADALRRQFGGQIKDVIDLRGVRRLGYVDAENIAERVLALYADGKFDVATLFYSQFRSVVSQIPTAQQLIPAEIPTGDESANLLNGAIYEYEPGEEEILDELLPRNVGVQIFKALLENAASEQGARMSAMDAATRNAGEMIKKLSLEYNRTRQAQITKELIEIISGAEAL
jgi:F-type H+-transporting ATPase subunit gamma